MDGHTASAIHKWRSCPSCLTEWPRTAAPERCPDCGHHTYAGRLATAFRAIQLNNGL